MAPMVVSMLLSMSMLDRRSPGTSSGKGPPVKLFQQPFGFRFNHLPLHHPASPSECASDVLAYEGVLVAPGSPGIGCRRRCRCRCCGLWSLAFRSSNESPKATRKPRKSSSNGLRRYRSGGLGVPNQSGSFSGEHLLVHFNQVPKRIEKLFH